MIAHHRGQSILIKKKCILATILSLRNAILKQQLQECIVPNLVMEYALSLGAFNGQVLPVWTHNELSQSFLHVHRAVGCTENCSTLVREAEKLIFRERACTAENDLVCRCAYQLCSAFPFSPSAFSPSLSLHTCTAGECGSLMTHPLQTSLLLDHIWAARKSLFSELVSRREAATAGTLSPAPCCFLLLLSFAAGTSNLWTDVPLF